MKKAILALADGTVFEGRALGFAGETAGELVFNTAMTGYQEILTDPSYKGQMVTMTCPHIGNYGVNRADVESRRVWADGFVVKESSRQPSNWRAERSFVGIEGLDTRALTRHLRDRGCQQAVISHVDLDPARAVEKARRAPAIVGRDLVATVTCREPYAWTESSGDWPPDDGGSGKPGRSFRVVVYDFGVKQNILRRLVDVGCELTVVPASTTAEAVKALNPDGIMLSNGSGALCRRGAPPTDRLAADALHLPGASDFGAGPGDENREIEIRTPRSQPPGDGPAEPQGRDHVAEPQLRGPGAGPP
jgi:carbamoyl-phosphate synthase small subunit